ncbi:hypothetical protein Ctob_007169, partial [Chrysochromulina tobinii]
ALHRRGERVHISTESCLQSEHALAHPIVLRTDGPLALCQLLAQGVQVDLVLRGLACVDLDRGAPDRRLQVCALRCDRHESCSASAVLSSRICRLARSSSWWSDSSRALHPCTAVLCSSTSRRAAVYWPRHQLLSASASPISLLNKLCVQRMRSSSYSRPLARRSAVSQACLSGRSSFLTRLRSSSSRKRSAAASFAVSKLTSADDPVCSRPLHISIDTAAMSAKLGLNTSAALSLPCIVRTPLVELL